MVIVREVFIAKPGMASKLAKLFKEEMAQEGTGRKFTVMTDLVGSYNQVVVEMEYEDLATFEKEMQQHMSEPKKEPDPSKPNFYEMYTHGKREVFRTW